VTTCSLCESGCGMRLRCVGEQPVGVAGVAEHPASHGSLCPAGWAAHHIPYHPQRVRQPMRRAGSQWKPVTMEQATAELADALGEAAAIPGAVAVLAGRSSPVSRALCQTFLNATAEGRYIEAPGGENATGAALAGLLGNTNAYGLDLENTRTLLSFGAPVLEGWGAPGRVMALWRDRGFRLIQVDSRQSVTASLADRWVPIRPGSELTFALGVAREMARIKPEIRRNLQSQDEYLAALETADLQAIYQRTGVAAGVFREVAAELLEHGPAVAIGGGAPARGPLESETEAAIAGLNILAGSAGAKGGLFPRTAADQVGATPLGAVPDHSIRVLILAGIAGSAELPWQAVQSKLAGPAALVVKLTPFIDPAGDHANLVIPTPVFLETLSEAGGAWDLPVDSFAVSTPALPEPETAAGPFEFLAIAAQTAGLACEALDMEDALKAHTEAIWRAKRGKVFLYGSHETKPVTDFESGDRLWSALTSGAIWSDDRTEPTQGARASLAGPENRFAAAFRQALSPSKEPANTAFPLVLMPYAPAEANHATPPPPLMAKLDRESGLRKPAPMALVNPQTAAELRLRNGQRARLTTACSECTVQVRVEASARPAAVELPVPAGPGAATVLGLCEISDGGAWRCTPAQLRRI
jgi:menaquinone reductase, molybdopterin-binding-like subunit